MIAVLHGTEGGFRNVFLVLAALACAVFRLGALLPVAPADAGRATRV